MEVKGAHKDYVEGLENLRQMVVDMEIGLEQLKREFYCCDQNEEEHYETYLKECNKNFLYCNNQLRKHDVTLQVIDSEVALISMLNSMREVVEEPDQGTMEFLLQFWQHLELCVGSIRNQRNLFAERIFKRLKTSCVSYKNGKNAPAVARRYSDTITEYERLMESTLKKTDTLLTGLQSGIRQDQFTNSAFSDRVLMYCDLKAFPLLRLIPDLTEKLESLFRTARQWIDKDETYIIQINENILNARNEAFRKTKALDETHTQRTELVKSVDEAYEVCCSNKAILIELETNLQDLEEKEQFCVISKKSKSEEKRQKEGMVGFLDISITQTKKNCGLQLKRSRLLRQLRELEQNLFELEKDISTIKSEIKEKNEQKTIQQEKTETCEQSYEHLKTELEKFTENVEKLQNEVNSLSESLSQLEVIQAIKTSQENVEDLYEQETAPVKLAPSLKEKIMKRRKLRNINKRKKEE